MEDAALIRSVIAKAKMNKKLVRLFERNLTAKPFVEAVAALERRPAVAKQPLVAAEVPLAVVQVVALEGHTKARR